VSVIPELLIILLVGLGRDEQAEVGHEQKLDFQGVHLQRRNATHTRVIRVVKVLIIKEFGGQHHTCDQQAVNVERVDHECRILLDDAVNVYEGKHKALSTAQRILRSSVQIVGNRDRRRSLSVEFADGLTDGQPVVSVT